MQHPHDEQPRTPMQLQVKYLLQALVVIAVTGLTILLLSRLFPFELSGRYMQSAELYFLVTIVNLVFFHTLAFHIVEETLRRVLIGTAITTLVASALLYGIYYLVAIVQ
ncbi:MAG: hypothetical protein JXA28_06600 [Bacteroidetes bacterium]|nr:hypothetical protein [Bacteroidota bacterium]